MGPIAVAAYSYMALVPIIQPPIMKLFTTKKERAIKMENLRPVSKLERILFPIVVTIVVCLILPTTAPLVGMLMLGNLFRESGVVRQLSETASNALMYIVVILLGTSVGASTSAEAFLNWTTIMLDHKGQDQSTDWFCRCFCRSNGSPCVTESRSRRRPDKLFTYACNGTKRCRCYRYCSSSRCIHGNLWNLGGIENHGRSC